MLRKLTLALAFVALTLGVRVNIVEAYTSPSPPPSVARMGVTPTANPESLYVLDATGAWVPIGSIDTTLHIFTSDSASGGADIRGFHCVADGVTDQTACINAALASYPGCIFIPPTPLGFYVAGTVTVPLCMIGTVVAPSQSTLSSANTSRILCNNQAAISCVVASRAGNLSVNIHDLALIGTNAGNALATPITGSIGFQNASGYNLILNNFQSANFGTCAYFGPTTGAGTGPISNHLINTFFSRCLNHYVVDDGIPELYFIGGRWGENGGSDYNSADDFIYATKTTTSGAGGGPNTIVLDSMHLNPGGKTVGCAFRWGGFAFTSGGIGANTIINSHIEVALGSGYTGSQTRGMFCADSTVPRVPEYTVTGSSFEEDGTPKVIPLFNIDAAVPFGNNSKMLFQGDEFQTAAFNLSVHNELFGFGPTFIGSWFFSAATFTAGDVTATAKLADNTFFGGYTIDGAWANLQLDHNSGAPFTDTATGSVFLSGQPTKNWTPQLTINGSATGITTSTDTGIYTRTPDGGYRASYNIILTSKGVGTGQVRIENLPLTCGAGLGTETLNVAQNFSGLVGSPFAQTASNDTRAFIEQFAATGQTAVLNTNLTDTTTLAGRITCGTAQ